MNKRDVLSAVVPAACGVELPLRPGDEIVVMTGIPRRVDHCVEVRRDLPLAAEHVLVKYQVRLSARVRGWLTVEAANKEEAEEQAVERFVAVHDIDDGIDDIEIEELPNEA